MPRKGILLAGGKGTRLYPMTNVISKQLLPVFDKPMIYYSLSVLMLADIKEILIITTERDSKNFRELLGDGNKYGINLTYEIQNKPKGIAEALIIGEKFLNGSESILMLGDNIFYGSKLQDNIIDASKRNEGATIFTYRVEDPRRYGVAEFNEDKAVISIEEKPINPKSNYAITGIYLYDKYAPEYAKSLSFSDRGEIEITDLNNIYLNKKKLFANIFDRGVTWLDAGTPESLLEAAQFVETIENRQGLKIACLEEIALTKKWIKEYQIQKIIDTHKKNSYINYLKKIIS